MPMPLTPVGRCLVWLVEAHRFSESHLAKQRRRKNVVTENTSHRLVIMYIRYNNNVFFHVVFLWIGAHSQSKELKHSQNKLEQECAHTHTHAHTHSHMHTPVSRIASRDEISEMVKICECV